MAKYNQKEAVYEAVSAFMHENNRVINDGDSVDLSSEDRKTIVTMIVTAISVGDMEFSLEAANNYDTPEKVRNYSTGLLSNWLRKDTRLNGGARHSIKNPGSKVGQSDPLIKQLKALKKELTNPKEIAKVDAEINTCIEQLRLKKSKNASINKDDLPAHLLHLVQKDQP